MSKKILRFLSLALVLATLFTLAMSVGAFGPTNRTSTSTVSVVTCGDKVFGKTSKITVKNTSSYPIYCSQPTSISGCTWSRGACFGYGTRATIYPGNSATFVLTTKFGKTGVMKFNIYSAYGNGTRYSASVTGTNYSCMALVG